MVYESLKKLKKMKNTLKKDKNYFDILKLLNIC